MGSPASAGSDTTHNLRPDEATAGPRADELERYDQNLRDLLGRVGRRDEGALSSFYEKTVNRVYALAVRITGRHDAAEEVCADVYLQVWGEAGRYDPTRGKVLGWLLTICRSRAIDSIRRRDQAEPNPDPDRLRANDQASDNDPQDLLLASERDSTLHRALGELSGLQRQLLSLAFFRGLTHDEIAAHSGIPLGSVKSHLRRALGLLRARLGSGASET